MKKALYNLFFFLLLVSFIITLPAKVNGQPQWTQSLSVGTATGEEIVNGVALDAAGNMYVTGNYSDVVDFGTGPLPAVGYQNATNGFVAKFSPAGVCQWAIPLSCA